MEENKPTKKNERKMSAWKLATLLAGGVMLLIIMARSMQEGYALQHTPDVKSKNVAKGLVIPLSADSLQTVYSLNADSTTNLYKDKTLLISGTIGEVDKYHTGESYIVFEKIKEAPAIKIECMFKKETAIDSLSKGQNVSVEGEVSFMKNVILIENAQVKK